MKVQQTFETLTYIIGMDLNQAGDSSPLRPSPLSDLQARLFAQLFQEIAQCVFQS